MKVWDISIKLMFPRFSMLLLSQDEVLLLNEFEVWEKPALPLVTGTDCRSFLSVFNTCYLPVKCL